MFETHLYIFFFSALTYGAEYGPQHLELVAEWEPAVKERYRYIWFIYLSRLNKGIL